MRWFITILLRFYDRRKGWRRYFYLGGWDRRCQGNRKQIKFQGRGQVVGGEFALGGFGVVLVLGVGVCVFVTVV